MTRNRIPSRIGRIWLLPDRSPVGNYSTRLYAKPCLRKSGIARVTRLSVTLAMLIQGDVSEEDFDYGKMDFNHECVDLGRMFQDTVSPDPFPERGYFTRSDQFPFVQQGIPAIFFATGFKTSETGVEPEALYNDFIPKWQKDDFFRDLYGTELTRSE